MNVLSLFQAPPPVITCPECDQMIMEGFGYPVVVHIGQSTIQDMCCGKDCAHAYKLRHLREEGL